MSLKGNLKTFYLASILQLLSADKKTGILTISDEGRMVRIYIKNGDIVHAVGTRKEIRIGYLLRTKGIISAEELRKALVLAKERKERLGKVLMEKGYVSPDTLKKFLHQQVRETLYDLFLWQEGEFEYVDKEFTVDEGLVTELHHMEVILEGTRRVDEWALLSKNIPHPQAVFKISKNVEQKGDSVNLTTNEWRIISLVDGKRTVEQIIADSGHDEFLVYRMLNSLVASGLLEKSEAHAATVTPGNDETSAIILLYHEVLQNLLQISKNASGARALTLFEEARTTLPQDQAGLLQDYDCEADAASNTQIALKGTGGAMPKREALTSAFNAWIHAILHKQKEVLNEQDLKASLEHFAKLDAEWREETDHGDLKGTILSGVMRTMVQLQHEVAQAGQSEEKAGGILSFLKRK